MELLRAIWKSPLVGVLSRLFLGGLFLFAAIIKMQDPHAFAVSISHYHLLPQPLWYPFALLLPCLEALCGVMLILGFWVEDSAIVAGLMLIAFLSALVSAYIRGIQIECGCFSINQTGNSNILQAILRDLGLLLLVFQIIRSKPTWRTALSKLPRRKKVQT